VHNGQATFANVAFELPEHARLSSPAARLYVRPHELEILRAKNGRPAMSATVSRVNAAGAVARVGLLAEGQDIQVELTPQRFAELDLRPGETVFVSPKKVRVFESDYQI
jgi:sulfate/thiosulfate transport system ATP-binding protein